MQACGHPRVEINFPASLPGLRAGRTYFFATSVIELSATLIQNWRGRVSVGVMSQTKKINVTRTGYSDEYSA